METLTTSHVEITILSAESLRIGRKWVKKNAYAVVRGDSNQFSTTTVATEGGCNPAWNEKVKLDLPARTRFITVEVQCKMRMGIKTVGTARVPVSDFMGLHLPGNHQRFLSYRLRDSEGDRNGIINLAVRVEMPKYESLQPGGSSGAVIGMPATEKMSFSGVVTGVPVWIMNSSQGQG